MLQSPTAEAMLRTNRLLLRSALDRAAGDARLLVEGVLYVSDLEVRVASGDVAGWSGVSRGTIANFERGARMPIRASLQALRRAFEEHGVMFLDGGDEHGIGVALANPTA